MAPWRLPCRPSRPRPPRTTRGSAPGDPSSTPTRACCAAWTRSCRTAHGLSLAEYDALLQLVNAPGRRLRMSVLAERVLLSRSGITRLVDRLVAAGFVERSACVVGCARRRGRADGQGPGAAPRGVADPPGRRPALLPRADPGPGPRCHRARLQRDPGRAGPRGGRRLVLHDRERLTPQPARSRGRLYAGTSGFAYPGLGAALLPAGPARDLTSSPTTPRGCRRSSSTTPSTPGRPRRRSRRGWRRRRPRSGSWSRHSAGRPCARSTAPRRSPCPG